jgi:iron(III) transport system ATP-binding protein
LNAFALPQVRVTITWPPTTTSMYLGDKWEHLFALGEERLRAYGDRPLRAGRHWLEVPKAELWVFR